MTPSVSIVVVTYQSEGFIGRCRRSIERHAATPVEVLVVDNGSADATLDEARAASPCATILPLGRNTGFAAAANAGAAQARARRLLFLNPDAELLPGALPRLVAYLD